MLEITLIAIAIPTTIVAGFLTLTLLLWKDAGNAMKRDAADHFEPADPVAVIGKRFYRGLQYAVIAVAVTAWSAFGMHAVGFV